jgi:hypothetical protein
MDQGYQGVVQSDHAQKRRGTILQLPILVVPKAAGRHALVQTQPHVCDSDAILNTTKKYKDIKI